MILCSLSDENEVVSPNMLVKDWIKTLQRLQSHLEFKNIFNCYYSAYESRIEELFRNELAKEE